MSGAGFVRASARRSSLGGTPIATPMYDIVSLAAEWAQFYIAVAEKNSLAC
jgi:hypothetical protein